MKKFALVMLLGSSFYLEAASVPTDQAIELCRAEQNALKRLTCYDSISLNNDSLTHQVSAAKEKSTTSIAAMQNRAEQTTVSAESAFGAKAKTPENEPDEIRVVVSKISTNARKELILEFTNGQVWRQKGSEYFQVAVGDTVIIKRGALSAFFLGTEKNNRTIRVSRDK